MTIVYTLIFILGIYYLVQYRLNLKKAVELCNKAIYPANKEDYTHILIPTEWKEMGPLSKNTRSYKIVKWGTIGILLLLFVLLVIVVTTDLIGTPFLSLAYILYTLLNIVRHQGNFYILSDGLILNSKYFPSNRIQHYEVEKIVRWHSLYGLNDRINNGYKLSFKIKKSIVDPSFVVIENEEQLEKIQASLEKLSIPYVETGSPK